MRLMSCASTLASLYKASYVVRCSSVEKPAFTISAICSETARRRSRNSCNLLMVINLLLEMIYDAPRTSGPCAHDCGSGPRHRLMLKFTNHRYTEAQSNNGS